MNSNQREQNMNSDLLQLVRRNTRTMHEWNRSLIEDSKENKTINLWIASININGLAKIEKLRQLYNYFIANNIDVLFVQEIRILANWEELNILEDFYYCSSNSNSSGVGIFVNRYELNETRIYKHHQLIILK